MSNVIIFPKAKRDAPPQTMEEVLENVEGARREHIEFLTDEVMSFVFQRCYDEGFDLGSEETMKQTALIVESFRAGLYKLVGMAHPLHAAADMMFVEDTDESTESEDAKPSEE